MSAWVQIVTAELQGRRARKILHTHMYIILYSILLDACLYGEHEEIHTDAPAYILGAFLWSVSALRTCEGLPIVFSLPTLDLTL